MKAKFKLAITKKKENSAMKLVLLLIFVLAPIVLLSLLLEYKMTVPEVIHLEITIPIYLVLVAVLTLVVGRSTATFVELWVTETAIESNSFESIRYKEIIGYNTIVERKLISLFTRIDFYSYKITLKNGKVILLIPRSSFGNSEKELLDFIQLFEIRIG
jgi:hypothetical protein